MVRGHSRIGADERAQHLVSTLVNGYSSGGHLGFARAVPNSVKLRSLFKKQASLVDSALKNAGSMGFAPQRFDTIMEVSTAIVLNLEAVVRTLHEVQIIDLKHKQWATDILATLSRSNLILLALLVELCRTASSYIHKFDNLKMELLSAWL